MADPRPYYRTLRDQHPVYYIEDLDTYALSRFDDVWAVLEINDGTFVASGERCRRRGPGRHQRRPGGGPAVAPTAVPRHFDARSTTTSAVARPVSSGPGRPACSRAHRELANQRLDALLPLGRFDLTQDYGGIVAASIV